MNFIRIYTFLFFLCFLFVGLIIYKDYGVHCDEYHNQTFGHNWKVYVLDVLKNGFTNNVALPHTEPYPMDWVHGSIIEVTLNLLKNILHINDLQSILYFRHLSCFLFFYVGVYFFYVLCKIYFDHKIISLLGCIFLVLSPNIFSHAFYNTFDIPFLSLYIISFYTLLKWLKEPSWQNIIWHVVTCALLIDIRLIGLVMPFYTLLAFILRKNYKHDFFQFISFSLLLLVFIIVGWPLLWSNPIGHFLKIFSSTVNHSFTHTILYAGKYYLGTALPWHYGPVWLLIITPLTYCLFFLVGFFVSVRRIKSIPTLLILCSLFLPFLITQGKLYTGYRHIFFIYIPFLIVSLIGLSFIWNLMTIKFEETIRKWILGLFICSLIVSIVDIAFSMVHLHPYEYLYFNRLAGKNMKEISSRFEMDYWGLAFRQALELIAKTDHDPTITVATIQGWTLIKDNLNILSEKDKKRFKEAPISEAKYILTNHLLHYTDYPLSKYASVKVENVDIVEIYQRNMFYFVSTLH